MYMSMNLFLARLFLIGITRIIMGCALVANGLRSLERNDIILAGDDGILRQLQQSRIAISIR